MDPAGGYLQGNYIFLIPFRSSETIDIWRDAFDLAVTFSAGEGIEICGDPQPEARFRNPYELLFSTNAAGGRILRIDQAGGQDFRYVSLIENDTTTAGFMDTVSQTFSILLEDIAPVFGTIDDAPVTVILGIHRSGGLEGMHAFTVNGPGNPMVMAHEMLHSWIGLRVGDLEDPWWKEGTANYLGFLIALRNGLIDQVYLDTNILVDLSEDPNVTGYALSDPFVRDNLFQPGAWMYQLAYTKGAQVCMLLDREIRVSSGQTTTLDGVLGAFVQEFDGKAFTREDYLLFITQYSGADVSVIFQEYVDKAGVIPDSVLFEAHEALMGMGAFGAVTAKSAAKRRILSKPGQVPVL
jgi:hypothetical protein